MVVQVAQLQLCTKNLPEKLVQAKSDLLKQIAETAKKCLGVNIEGKQVFESIISRPAPPTPAPFVLSSMLVEKKKVPLNSSRILNQIDILALIETFFKLKFKFHLPGYDICKNDRLVGTKGGVAILVKKGIIVNQN